MLAPSHNASTLIVICMTPVLWHSWALSSLSNISAVCVVRDQVQTAVLHSGQSLSSALAPPCPCVLWPGVQCVSTREVERV